MPVPQILKESEWKAKGLPLRTTIEKVKKAKTGVSEVLRAYAVAEALPLAEAEKKGKALRELAHTLQEARNNHKGNAKLTPVLVRMSDAVAVEKQRLRAEFNSVTLESLFADANIYNSVRAYAATQRSEENLDFLHAVIREHQPAAQIYQRFIASGSPQQVNIDSAAKHALDANQNDQHGMQAAVNVIEGLVKTGLLQTYRSHFQAAIG